MTKALALISGGLDSTLAAKLLMEQGIEVIGICFKSAFFGSKNAEKMAAQIGMELKVIDFTDEHLKMTKNPKYGYGKNMNPCIDCHAMMLKYAGRLMEELGADFIATGEVLNQRPMSQNRKALDTVKNESGYENKILRPLCALNLPKTEMEEKGLVDRSKLLGISGKSRKVQMELAKKYGIVEYPSPAGGCCLTEPGFAKKLEDLYEYDIDNASLHDIELLRVGRHFRLSPAAKAISTRNGEEYPLLMKLLKDYYIVFNAAEYSGTTLVLIPQKGSEPSEEDIYKAARITARYSKGKDAEKLKIRYKKSSEKEYNYIDVSPYSDEEIRGYMIGEGR